MGNCGVPLTRVLKKIPMLLGAALPALPALNAPKALKALRALRALRALYSSERNAEITLPISSQKSVLQWGFQGLRSTRNRSLLKVNEDFECKRNAEITLQNAFFTSSSQQTPL